MTFGFLLLFESILHFKWIHMAKDCLAHRCSAACAVLKWRTKSSTWWTRGERSVWPKQKVKENMRQRDEGTSREGKLYAPSFTSRFTKQYIAMSSTLATSHDWNRHDAHGVITLEQVHWTLLVDKYATVQFCFTYWIRKASRESSDSQKHYNIWFTALWLVPILINLALIWSFRVKRPVTIQSFFPSGSHCLMKVLSWDSSVVLFSGSLSCSFRVSDQGEHDICNIPTNQKITVKWIVGWLCHFTMLQNSLQRRRSGVLSTSDSLHDSVFRSTRRSCSSKTSSFTTLQSCRTIHPLQTSKIKIT